MNEEEAQDHYHANIPKETLDARNKFIAERWEDLSKVYVKQSDEIAKLLFYINSGGVATLIGFMGASESVRSVTCLQIALVFFAVGLVFSVILRAMWVHQDKRILDGWQSDVKRYWNGEIGFTELMKNDDDRVGSDIPNYIVGYISGGAFVVGLILGVISLFTY
jgi:hypothetical protein